MFSARIMELSVPEEPSLHHRRRRTDGAIGRPFYRAVAEEAYRLFVADGRNRDRLLAYWQQADAAIMARVRQPVRRP
jgi:hypothetical protein